MHVYQLLEAGSKYLRFQAAHHSWVGAEGLLNLSYMGFFQTF
jgi:hypothetical protein